ncbi:hypothetical protein [Marinobacterium litorale]|uniref:hypothetical protein n=1 Tax=Marinobacterium litorale TaxID=404770 RepID=UPI000417DA05|nr:hypothetical protein [Marinobacterium litorale]
MRGSFEWRLSLGMVNGWGFGSGGLDGMDAAGQFGGGGFDSNSGGSGGPNGSAGYNDNFGMREAAKDAIDSGMATAVGGGASGGHSDIAARAMSAFKSAPRSQTRAARATSMDRRDALKESPEDIAKLDAPALTAATLKMRDIDGYNPSTASDRQGFTDRENQSRGYSESAMEAADEAYANTAKNGLVGTLSYGINPALGVGVNAAIDAVQSANFRDAYGMERDTVGAIGGSLKGQVSNLAGGLLGGKVGGALGGAAFGAPGMIAGTLLGKAYGADALGKASADSIGKDNTNTQSPSATGLLNTNQVATASKAQPAPSQTTTGYQSKFGNYSSHLNNFSSRALSAWA